MKEAVVIATTYLDAHSMMMTRESLEGAAEALNNGSRQLFTVEHDATIPPLGKVLEAWVEPIEDGEYQLVVTRETFEEPTWITLPTGAKLLKQESEVDHNPFASRYKGVSDGYELSCDWVNFESPESVQEFLDDIRNASGVDFTDSIFGRKSATPDPEFFIRIAETIGAYLVAKKVVDKAGDKVVDLVMEDVAKFYAFVKAIAGSAIKYTLPKNRPVTYIFVVSYAPVIEFIVRSNNPNSVLSAVSMDKLEKATSDAMDLHENLGADKIQYLLNQRGEWEFNYLLTRTGQVIGTKQAYSRRTKKIELQQAKLKKLNNGNKGFSR